MPKLFTDLNLDGSVPPRAQPRIGEWGPEGVPTTKSKRRARIWASLALVLVLTAIALGEWYLYRILNGS